MQRCGAIGLGRGDVSLRVEQALQRRMIAPHGSVGHLARHLRVRAPCAAAERVARHFDGHPLVAEVLYPGLVQAQGHEVSARQMAGGFGGMLSIRARGGEAAAVATAAHTALWKRATSLGGVESLIEHRASIEGSSSPVPTDLLRLSVGIEDAGDLIRDLEQALPAAAR